MPTPTYAHVLRSDGWHVVGPEVDYLVIDGAHIVGAELHSATIASFLSVAYAAGQRDMVQEMSKDSQEKLDAMRRT